MSEITHSDCQLLSQPWRNKAQHDSSHCNTHPKSCRCHSTREFLGIAHFEHELDDPAAKSNLNTYVAEEKDGTDPCDASVREADQRFFHAIVFCATGARIGGAENGTSFFPKGGAGGGEFNHRHDDLTFISAIPV